MAEKLSELDQAKKRFDEAFETFYKTIPETERGGWRLKSISCQSIVFTPGQQDESRPRSFAFNPPLVLEGENLLNFKRYVYRKIVPVGFPAPGKDINLPDGTYEKLFEGDAPAREEAFRLIVKSVVARTEKKSQGTLTFDTWESAVDFTKTAICRALGADIDLVADFGAADFANMLQFADFSQEDIKSLPSRVSKVIDSLVPARLATQTTNRNWSFWEKLPAETENTSAYQELIEFIEFLRLCDDSNINLRTLWIQTLHPEMTYEKIAQKMIDDGLDSPGLSKKGARSRIESRITKGIGIIKAELSEKSAAADNYPHLAALMKSRDRDGRKQHGER